MAITTNSGITYQILSLVDLADVQFTTLVSGQVLTYSNGYWKNATSGGGGGGSATLPQHAIGFGDASNILTGDAVNFFYDTSSKVFQIGYPGSTTSFILDGMNSLYTVNTDVMEWYDSSGHQYAQLTNNQVKLGNLSGSGNQTSVDINDNANTVTFIGDLYGYNNPEGFFYFSNNIAGGLYSWGDDGSAINHTNIILDATNNKAYIYAASGTTFDGPINLPKVITPAGTTGARTINAPTGSVNFAIGASSLVVTNSLVTADSVIQCTIAKNDNNFTALQITQATGSFTIYALSPPASETRVNFTITN